MPGGEREAGAGGSGRRTLDGRVVRVPVAANLAPSGRQLDLTIQWRQPLRTGANCGSVLS